MPTVPSRCYVDNHRRVDNGAYVVLDGEALGRRGTTMSGLNIVGLLAIFAVYLATYGSATIASLDLARLSR